MFLCGLHQCPGAGGRLTPPNGGGARGPSWAYKVDGGRIVHQEVRCIKVHRSILGREPPHPTPRAAARSIVGGWEGGTQSPYWREGPRLDLGGARSFPNQGEHKGRRESKICAKGKGPAQGELRGMTWASPSGWGDVQDPDPGGAGLPRHSWKAEPSRATSEASTRHLLSDRSPQGSSSLRAGGGGGGCGGGAACAFLRAGLLGASGASVGLGAAPRGRPAP